jgi:hypothetical protein
MQRAQGFAEQGGKTVFTAGIASTTLVQTSAPFAAITVFFTGTTRLAFLYSDNALFPTPLTNPFTADANGHWFFYAPNGRYDVMISSPLLGQPWTIGDILLNDGGGGGGGVGMNQTPWLSNIDGGGFNLTNVANIDVIGGFFINGVPIGNPGLWTQVGASSSIYHQGFVGIINQNPAFALDVQGGVNVTDNFYINGVAISAPGTGPWTVLGPSTINYNGNVGINNTAPAYALDVHGSINVNAGSNFFINGVAIGGAVTQPWQVLTGNRIWYAGQVGVGVNPPSFPIDVLGDVNITGAYRINGVPLSISGGQGLWLAGANNSIFYNGGNVGVGTAVPPTAISTPGVVSAGAFALISTPTVPLINTNGQFVGAGVDTTGGGGFGIIGAYIQSGTASAPGDVVATRYVEANNGFAITNFVGGGAQSNLVINQNGAFIGAGVDVRSPVLAGQYGLAAAYIQSDGNIVSEQTIEANVAFYLAGNWNAVVINTAGAFVGAGVQVGNYGVGCGGVISLGPLEAQSGTLQDGRAGAGFFNGDLWVAGAVRVSALIMYNNPGAYVINPNGAFTGAGVDVRGPASEGIAANYIQSDGNIVANGGFVEATSGFVIAGFGTVINSAGAWVGPPIGGGGATPPAGSNQAVQFNNGGVFGGNSNFTTDGAGNVLLVDVTGTSAYMVSWIGTGTGFQVQGQNVISGTTYVGSGGVSTGGNVTCSTLQANSAVNSSGSINAGQYLTCQYGVEVGGSVVIDQFRRWAGAPLPAAGSSGQFQFNSGGVLAASSIYTTTGGDMNGVQSIAVSGAIYNGGALVINNGIFSGFGVQTSSDIFGGLFGINGVAVGVSGTFTAASGQTITVNGGIVIGIG